MKPTFQLTLLTFSLLSLSPAVLAQSYSGTVGDLNTVFEPVGNINATLCDGTITPGPNYGYKACSDGVSAARWMAEKYAKNAGKYLGCLDGFYQGVTDGYNSGINPTSDMLQQAAAYVKGATFDSASSRGLDRARAEGQTESADQIIARYRSVVGLKDSQGRQVLPNKDYNYPKVTFNGFGDGYEYDVLKQMGSDFDAVYAAGWVNKSSRFEDRLAARKGLALQNEYASSLCNLNGTMFGRRNMPSISIWDFFRANRQYNFENYGWRNADWAWEIFDRDERTLEQYQTFSRLKTLEKEITETIAIKETRYKLDAAGLPIRKLDANGQPAVDAQGKAIFEMEEVITGYRNETKRVKLSDAEVQALANQYINAFKQAYDRYYARQYASQNYYQEGIEKYKVAKIIGKTMGEEVASHVARREAYNNQYQIQSAKKYAEEVKRLYKASFDRLMGIFENNSVVELNEAEIVGQVPDMIFRPGEELKVQFTVTNLGEKESPSSMSFVPTSDIQSTVGDFSFVAPVLTRSNFVSSTLGRVTDMREARTTVNVGMVLRNPGDLADVARSLMVRKDKTINLNDYVEIDGVNGNLDFLSGSLSLLVNLKNPAKNVESPLSILEASIGNLGLSDKNIEPIGPGATRQAVVNVENMDPLELIILGTINGSVNVRLGNKIAHHQAISYAISMNRVDALTTYHDALATKKSMNTGRQGKADRLAKLQGMLEELVKADIEKNVLWKKGEEVNGTIVAVVQRVYDESKRAGRINDEAQKIYDDLGNVMARNVKDVRNGGGIRLAKPNKENFLKEISKFAKISTRVKDWNK